jgi:hypothetical protein
MNLLTEWARWKCGSPPYVLDADRPVLMSSRSRQWLDTATWPNVYRGDTFCAPGNTKLHLGLLPQPFFGDLRRASIYILLLNPGVRPADYYGEYAVPAYRKALLAILKQEFAANSIPFQFLDPQFSWHGGFGWWHGKFARVIERLAEGWNVSFAEARARLGSKLASIELVPYHSPAFHDRGWIRESPFCRPRPRVRERTCTAAREARRRNRYRHPESTYLEPAEPREGHQVQRTAGPSGTFDAR